MDHKNIIELEHMLSDEGTEPKALPLSLLKRITNDFSDDKKIGHGSFAVVYKGMLDNGTVAVKKLLRTLDIDEKQFSKEVHCLMKAKHKNIVRFLGYCSDTQGEMVDYKGQLVLAEVRQRLLCLEYLSQGSLDKQITDASCGLEWKKRYQIINGICEGLYYLHKNHILHLDLKPANILLDDNMVPKIADFGISRFFDEKQSQVTTSSIVGTIGYLAPEFFGGRKITFKLDIYILGILIIDILTGEKGYPDIDSVRERWRNRLEKTQSDTQLVQVRVCTEIAIQCIDPDPAKRPDTQYIIDRLGATRSADESDIVIREAQIIGRTEETQKILSTLSGSITPEFTVLPIYGIGGIGKTTLAQLIFNDSQFTGYTRVWVYVSQNLDLKKIGNTIISQLSEASHVAEKQMIHNHLRKLLAGKKILIVLDDVWEKNPYTLKTLKAMLRLGARSMVTVIVTTRSEGIARQIFHTVEPYKLDILKDKICWRIIKQKTAFKDRVDKKELKIIGREMATKCGGVALVAQSLGYMLNGKTSDEWKSVRDNYIWSVPTLEGSSSRDHEVLSSLMLIYNHMSECLKLCFSYCALFPKGHNIGKYDLIHQWIALGFTEPSKLFDSMQLCEKYVMQLLGMSFLEYSKTSLSDRRGHKDLTLFTMHDLVHDLATMILADQVNDKGNDGGNRYRYALLTNCSKPLQVFVSSPAIMKALHFRKCGKLELHHDAFSLATGLNVLDLSECLIQRLPDSIGQLKQLRYLHAPQIKHNMIPNCITELSELNYLNLKGSNIFMLPKSMGDMKGLMHLDLSGCSFMLELPVSFAELKQLVHLDLSHCHMSISEAFAGFTKLQYLNLSVLYMTFADRKGFTNVIGNLVDLRYLNLSGCLHAMAPSVDQIGSLLDSISTLSNLEHLDLSKNRQLSSIPETMGNLRKLHTLDLLGCNELRKLLDTMVNMVSLKVLNVDRRVTLDESVISLLNAASLPHFVVHASSNNCSSNVICLQPTNPIELTIDRLENVKSSDEAQSIKLIEKQNIKELKFQWTVAAGRFVDDKEVLEKLVPPSSVQILRITGYRGVSIPDWFMGISHHLPNLTGIKLCDFPTCNNLEPLGELPNLQWLSLCRLESLEEWNTAYTSGKKGVNEFMFPKLEKLTIKICAKLRIKPCLPARVTFFEIVDCDNMLVSSWGESSSHNGSSSSSQITDLIVERSKVPLCQWWLLHHLPAIRSLTITSCGDLTTSAEILKHLSSLESLSLQELYSNVELSSWFVEMASLQSLTLLDCTEIRSLPDSIQQMTKLECLDISGCPTLEKWCKSEENKMKLGHIECKNIGELSEEETFTETTNNVYTEIGSKINNEGKIAVSVEETIDLIDGSHADLLYTAVMNMPGFTEEALLVALSHLMDNNAQASAYMGMRKEDRLSWLMNFLKKHY